MISPPPWNGPPGVLDRSAFGKSIKVLAAEIPASKTGVLLKSPELRGSLLDLPKVKTVVPNPSDPNTSRLLLLRAATSAELSPTVLEFLQRESNGLLLHTLHFDYTYWTADDILQMILPEALREESPVGFSVVGHIAHLNLNEEYLPYKHTIGQVVLDKNPTIRTVVNKLDSIHNQFRFFKMEVLAGDPDFIVQHLESDCRFTFDFSKVYWNSRLHMEHARLIAQFSPQDVVVDVFAGVGPFAVPAGKQGMAVVANDLNPDSHKYLVENIHNNRVSPNVRAFCEDGRSFIPAAAKLLKNDPFPPYQGPIPSLSEAKKIRRHKTSETKTEGPPRNRISHFIMNLPDSAITFLDAFKGIFSSDDLRSLYSIMPMIHCYCFTRELDPELAQQDITQRVEETMGHALDGEVGLHLVRSVAPNKNMYCISFRLPVPVALGFK